MNPDILLQLITSQRANSSTSQTSIQAVGIPVEPVCYYDPKQKWRRFTVAQMVEIYKGDPSFVKPMGARGNFLESWVMPKRRESVIDGAKMEQLLHLFFSTNIADAMRHFPVNAKGDRYPGGLKRLAGDYLIVGRNHNGVRDLLRDGIIHQVSEHTKFVKHEFPQINFEPSKHPKLYHTHRNTTALNTKQCTIRC